MKKTARESLRPDFAPFRIGGMKLLHHPPVYFTLTTLLGLGIGRWINLKCLFPSGTWVFSLILSLLAFAIATVAIVHFKLKCTAVRPFHEPTALVHTGLYHITRNPMYLALLLTQVAILTAFSEPLSLVVVPVFWWILHTGFVVREEQILREKFGEQYERYVDKTRRWL